ncbi:D-alanine--D-alanine ligase [Sesbania bispinosa]|nr:D-alanine--D-alanine ligase [Sesbania bispinosa]
MTTTSGGSKGDAVVSMGGVLFWLWSNGGLWCSSLLIPSITMSSAALASRDWDFYSICHLLRREMRMC